MFCSGSSVVEQRSEDPCVSSSILLPNISESNGAKWTRTIDLIHAKYALYQLSYNPITTKLLSF